MLSALVVRLSYALPNLKHRVLPYGFPDQTQISGCEFARPGAAGLMYGKRGSICVLFVCANVYAMTLFM